MKLGLHISDFTWPDGPTKLSRDLPRIARSADEAGFDRISVMDHVWQINHIGQVYGVMDEVFQFTATFKEFPPRSFPPSFVPTTIMEQTMDDIKDARRRSSGGNK